MNDLSLDARQSLDRRQTELLHALQGVAASPAGFDEHRVRAAARALLFKRRRSLARAWPQLAGALGPRFGEIFAAFAAAVPLPSEGDALADGYALAAWLAEQGEWSGALSDEARRERMAVWLNFAPTAGGLLPRRWPCAAVERLPHTRRLLLAGGWPGWGQWAFSVPWV